MRILQLLPEEIESLIEEQIVLLHSGHGSNKRINYLKKQLSIIIRRKRIVKNKNISRIIIDPLVTKQTHECAICFEIHPFTNLLKTRCNHYFGKQCYNNWRTLCKEKVTCPCCRKVNPPISFFINIF